MQACVTTLRALLLAGSMVATAAACKGPRDEHAGGTVAGRPAVWEPIDADFKGCEGG
jgi:hypothetical protein